MRPELNSMACRLLLVDLNNAAKRAYHGGADPLAMLRGIIRRHAPTHMVCIRDPHGPTWHHALDPDNYKAARKSNGPSSGELVDELAPRLAEAGYSLACAEGFCADDLIATLSARACAAGTEVLIYSGDKDLLQCARPECTILRPENGGGERKMGPKDVLDFLGVLPHQVPDWIALCGDASDGIPKIGAVKQTKAGPRLYGFTEKRAAEVVQDWGNLHALLDDMPGSNGAVLSDTERRWLSAGRERALLNLRLATLREDASVEVDPRATRVRTYA
jgi:DNA polymerase-1